MFLRRSADHLFHLLAPARLRCCQGRPQHRGKIAGGGLGRARGGVTFFNRSNTLLDRLAPVDRAKTDTGTARQSYNDFSELTQKFPNSKYAEDARQRMLFLHNSLATYEVHVADHYLQRGAYVAAVNRAKYVLENYSRTPAAADALSIMTQAYVKMNMPQLAADSLRVLQHNYPDSPDLPKLNALVKGAG